MIPQSNFAQLTVEQQLQYIRHHGKYVATRRTEPFCTNVYRLRDFFAEVCFDPRRNAVQLISSYQADPQTRSYQTLRRAS